MKAVAIAPKTRTVALIDLDPPRLERPSDVLVRILDVGVCGTDREICAFEYGTPPAGADRLVIGHEALGQVEAVGSAVTRVRPGDLVAPMVRRPCSRPECRACHERRQDFCYTGLFSERGIKEADGFMTEFVLEDERALNVVPPELREIGVLCEPLTIAEKALRQVDEVQSRLPWACAHEIGKPAGYCHRAVVLGAGPVGLLGAMALAATGYRVTVYSREPAPNPKADLLAEIGIHYASATEVTPAQLAARVGNIDLVYEASGASAASFALMEVLGTNGVFVFTGVPGRKADRARGRRADEAPGAPQPGRVRHRERRPRRVRGRDPASGRLRSPLAEGGTRADHGALPDRVTRRAAGRPRRGNQERDLARGHALMREHAREYACEALLLGLFMVSAGVVTTALEAPGSPLVALLPGAFLRRALIGFAMGLTAIALIYSPFGQRSGAHMNPALTLTYLRLGKIGPRDAFAYAVAQVAGGIAGVALVALVLGRAFEEAPVSWAATRPGAHGPLGAFAAEVAISFGLMTTALVCTGLPRIAPYTGWFCGALVALYITFEAPLSGMSMNPARSLASALFPGFWSHFWVYLAGPLTGMLVAAELYGRVRGAARVRCAKLFHSVRHRCIFCGYAPGHAEVR